VPYLISHPSFRLIHNWTKLALGLPLGCSSSVWDFGSAGKSGVPDRGAVAGNKVFWYRSEAMTKTMLLIVAGFGLAPGSQAAPGSIDQEVAAAVLPLPDQLRNGAAVVRLNAAGYPEHLRKGTNTMVCIANRPGIDRFDVRCYQEDFIGVVYRAFQLNAEGIRGEKQYDQIEAEIKAAKISLPSHPSAGYRCAGPAKAYNASTNTATEEIYCWESVHFPFRTARELGLMDESEIPENMQRRLPFVMSSGRYWSHVMIMHPNGGDHAH